MSGHMQCCAEAGITDSIPVTSSVVDTDGIPQEGLPVYAFIAAVFRAAQGPTPTVTFTPTPTPTPTM